MKLWQQLQQRWQWVQRFNPFWAASGRRALIELLLVQVVLLLIGIPLTRAFVEATWGAPMEVKDEIVIQYSVVYLFLFLCGYTLGSVLWYAFRWRLRPQTRSPWQQLYLELLVTIGLWIESLVSLVLLLLISSFIPFFDILQIYPFGEKLSDFIEKYVGLPYIALFLVFSVIFTTIFIGLRIGIYVGHYWNNLRRRHLRWALTHAQLMLVVWGGVIMSLLLFIMMLRDWSASSNQTIIMNLFALLFTTMILFIFVFTFVILFLLPPAALFSFLFLRPTTRRIEVLAQAAGAIRKGVYSTRIKVEGQDEVARLQEDFNAMATELEQTLHALQEERDNVSTLLNARRELIASVSHELRTPVATVRSYLESTLSSWNEKPPTTLRQDLQTMEQQVLRLQVLINDLFTLARAEVGRLEMRTMPVNVELLIRRVVDMMAPIVWRSSRIEIVADIATVEPAFPRILGDENRLEQIIQNLLHNAVRHTAPGGIIVVSALVTEDEYVELRVMDTGEGIAPEELEQIWERFYRARNTRDKSGSGSGLGLAIVKELTEAMGGVVSVTSEPGQGTCFILRFPQVTLASLATIKTGVLLPLSFKDIKEHPQSYQETS